MSAPAPRRTAALLVGVAVMMGALSFAAVPFYSWFCRVTGFAGATVSATTGADRVLDRSVTIRFDASTDRALPWDFKPAVREMKLKIGETGLAFYEASNPTDRPVAGRATYNVTPDLAGGYFTKIDCFCFTMQVLEPGETVMMPVTFYVDPDMVEDDEAKFIHTITLYYTFYPAELPPDRQAHLPAPTSDTISVN
jgi:cytochrome c oxidase assembly protein subunit 11